MTKPSKKLSSPSQKTLAQKPIHRMVLSGGGARGVVYAGAYRAIVETGLYTHVEELAGASAGALTASLIASGITPKEIHKAFLNTNFSHLMGDWTNLRNREAILPGAAFFSRCGQPLLKIIRTHIVQSIKKRLSEFTDVPQKKQQDTEFKALLKKLNKKEPRITFSDLNILNRNYPQYFKKLTVLAVRAIEGTHQIFNSQLTPDVEVALACRASASIPGVFEPIEIEINGIKERFIDGGIYDNIPTDYFDINDAGEFIENIKPDQTLVLAFGENLDNNKNPVHKALHGERHDEILKEAHPPKRVLPVLYDPGFVEKFTLDKLMNWLCQMDFPYANSERYEKTLHTIRAKYPLRTIELRTSDLQPLHFDKATQHSRTMTVLGYLDAINFIVNHDLHEYYAFDARTFYNEIVQNFEEILAAMFFLSHTDIKQNDLHNKILALKTDLQHKDFPQTVISRESYYLIKEHIEAQLDSVETFAFIRAVELHTQQISPEQLLQEKYLEEIRNTRNTWLYSAAYVCYGLCTIALFISALALVGFLPPLAFGISITAGLALGIATYGLFKTINPVPAEAEPTLQSESPKSLDMPNPFQYA